MFQELLPVAQFMPGIGAPSPLGCAIGLFILATYVGALVAIAFAIASRFTKTPFVAKLARWAAAISFANGVLLVIYFSYVMRWDFRDPAPLLIIGAIPALLGVIASTIAGVQWRVAAIAVVLAAIAGACVFRDHDYRMRRDAIIEATKAGDAPRV